MYYNSIDLVPMAWASLANVKSLFSANLSCGIGMKLVVDGITAWLTNRDEVTYVQPNGQGTPLNNSSIVTDDWFQEIGAQHDTNLYLRLLGAPPLLP